MTQLVALLPLRLDDVDGGTDVGRTLSTHSEIKEEKENDTAYFTINKKENLLIPFSDLSLKKKPLFKISKSPSSFHRPRASYSRPRTVLATAHRLYQLSFSTAYKVCQALLLSYVALISIELTSLSLSLSLSF